MRSIRYKIVLAAILAVSAFDLLPANFSSDRQKDYTAIVKAWNDAHNNWHFKDLEKLYTEKVLFYCSSMGKQECISYKTSLANPSKVYAQKILSDIIAADFGKGFIKCEFTKEIIIDDKKAEYPAYLILKDFGDSLKIVCESDEITDASFGFEISPAMFQPKAKSAETKEPAAEPEASKSNHLLTYSLSSTVLIIIIAIAVRRRKKKQESSN